MFFSYGIFRVPLVLEGDKGKPRAQIASCELSKLLEDILGSETSRKIHITSKSLTRTSLARQPTNKAIVRFFLCDVTGKSDQGRLSEYRDHLMCCFHLTCSAQCQLIVYRSRYSCFIIPPVSFNACL